jgi:hypothetical protein
MILFVCCLPVGSLSAFSVHESGVREQSEMSYGAKDGVWKSYFIFLIAFLSFLRFPSFSV